MDHSTVERYEDSRITAIEVNDDHERIKCLQDIAGTHILSCLYLEHSFFDAMRLYNKKYTGGGWKYYKLSNGGLYVALITNEELHMVSPNGFECDVDTDTAGLIVSAHTYSNLSFGPNGEAFGEEYHKLFDYIRQHPKVTTIRAALD